MYITCSDSVAMQNSQQSYKYDTENLLPRLLATQRKITGASKRKCLFFFRSSFRTLETGSQFQERLAKHIQRKFKITRLRRVNLDIYSYNKSQQDVLFLSFIRYRTHMFRTDLLSIIRSLNTVYTAIVICHTGCVDCLLARSGPSIDSFHYKNISRSTFL